MGPDWDPVAARRPPAASSCTGVDSPHTCAIVVKRRRLPEGTSEFFRGMRSRKSLTGSIRQTLSTIEGLFSDVSRLAGPVCRGACQHQSTGTLESDQRQLR
jgi:hypothetical protein